LQTNCCLVIFINTVIKVGRIANWVYSSGRGLT
jgi:hypothetical protein